MTCHKKHLLYGLISTFCLWLNAPALAQNAVGDALFDQNRLHDIYIDFDYAEWFDSLKYDYTEYNLTDPLDTIPDRYFRCFFSFDGMERPNVGMRIKGNSSWFFTRVSNETGKKVPFKIKIDAFKDQKLDGIREFNLNNFSDDPTYVKEALIYDMMRAAGVPAPRTSYARLYVNGEYRGLYLLIENVDKTFLRRHYGAENDEGNLYKTKRNAAVHLTDLGDDYRKYNEAGLLLKTNETANDWTRLFEFIKILNHLPRDSQAVELSRVFNVEGYLDVLAFEVMTYNWDTYWSGGNNFYLYEHPDGRIHWIPWDQNESLSSKVGAIFPVIEDVFVSKRAKDRPLIQAIFIQKHWQEVYLDKICRLCDSIFCMPYVLPRVTAWREQIRDAVRTDENALGAYHEFERSLTDYTWYDWRLFKRSESLNIREKGLAPYLSERRIWALDQIEKQGGTCAVTNYQPDTYDLDVLPNPSDGHLQIKWPAGRAALYQFELYDITGKQVAILSWQYQVGEQTTWVLPELPSGLYFLLKRDIDGFIGSGKLIIRQ